MSEPLLVVDAFADESNTTTAKLLGRRFTLHRYDAKLEEAYPSMATTVTLRMYPDVEPPSKPKRKYSTAMGLRKPR